MSYRVTMTNGVIVECDTIEELNALVERAPNTKKSEAKHTSHCVDPVSCPGCASPGDYGPY